MNIYRSSGNTVQRQGTACDPETNARLFSGRFAAVCAARSSTPCDQQLMMNNNDLCAPPTPCSSIRDRQVLNRTPINNLSHAYYHGSQPSSCTSSSKARPWFSLLVIDGFACHLVSTSTVLKRETHEADDDDDEEPNDENSPIKSASYMDELRQRLERVLSDPTSPTPSSSSSSPSPAPPVPATPPPLPSVQQSSSNVSERYSGLPVSKSFRLPMQPGPAQIHPSTAYRPAVFSRMPLKSNPSTPTHHLIQPPTKAHLRGPTLIIPPKLKSSAISQCLSSTENLRSTDDTHQRHPSALPMTVGSTPLPRKQLQPYHILDRNLSYRTTHQSNQNQNNSYGYHYSLSNGTHHQQQMSKSFIIPSKRDGKARCCRTLLASSFLSRLSKCQFALRRVQVRFAQSRRHRISSSLADVSRRSHGYLSSHESLSRLQQIQITHHGWFEHDHPSEITPVTERDTAEEASSNLSHQWSTSASLARQEWPHVTLAEAVDFDISDTFIEQIPRSLDIEQLAHCQQDHGEHSSHRIDS